MRSRLDNTSPPGVNVWQKILRVLLVISFIALAGATFLTSQSANTQVKLLTSNQRPSKLFSLAESKALIYAIRLEQWSHGLKVRNDAELARAMLTQEFTSTNPNGDSPIKFASPDYLSALKDSVAILNSTVPGLLPAELQKSVNAGIQKITEEIIFESKALTDTYQRHLDSKSIESSNWKSLQGHAIFFFLFLLLFLVLVGALVFLNGKSERAASRRREVILQDETEDLNLLIEKLALSESAVANLQELSKTKTAFVTNMNHELRTPLGSIIGYVEVVRDMTDNQPELGIGQYLEIVDRNANMLLGLVDDIFSLSKLDSNHGPLADISVDIVQVIEDSIIMLQPDRERNNISVTLMIDPDGSYFVQGDMGQLIQMIVNLLSNSIKFSPSNSEIYLEVSEVKHENNFNAIKIVIRDNGIGIPAKEIGKLFTRFYRAKNAMEKQFPGTGLGLAIVEQIVHLHGGTIRVESVEGEGTTFTVELPKNLSPAEELVLNRRHTVLLRAITELEESTRQNLYQVSHSLSGLIGFYTFEEESRLIRDFSNWIHSGSIIDPIDLEKRRQSLLSVLKLRLAALPQMDAV